MEFFIMIIVVIGYTILETQIETLEERIKELEKMFEFIGVLLLGYVILDIDAGLDRLEGRLPKRLEKRIKELEK